MRIVLLAAGGVLAIMLAVKFDLIPSGAYFWIFFVAGAATVAGPVKRHSRRKG